MRISNERVRAAHVARLRASNAPVLHSVNPKSKTLTSSDLTVTSPGALIADTTGPIESAWPTLVSKVHLLFGAE